MSDSKYTYYNKGKKYEFDLDELTDEELTRFEKMTEKQRLRFITSFDIKKQGFKDTLSIKTTKTENEQRLPKYNELQKYTNKLKEVESIMKDIKDRHDDYEWKDIDKISILDDDGLIDDSFKEYFNSINKDDIATVKNDAGVDEVSLGMLRRYFKKQVDKFNPSSSKNIFETLKSLFDQSKILINPDKRLDDKAQLNEEIDILREKLSKWKGRDVKMNDKLSDEEISLMMNYIKGNNEFEIIEAKDLEELKNKTFNGLKIFESKYSSFITGQSLEELLGKKLYKQYKDDLEIADKNGTKEDQIELAEIIAKEVIEMPEIPRIVKDNLRQAMIQNSDFDEGHETSTNTTQADTQSIKPSDSSNSNSDSEFKFISEPDEGNEDEPEIADSTFQGNTFKEKEIEGKTNKVRDKGNKVKDKVEDEITNIISEIVDSIPEVRNPKEKVKLQKMKEKIRNRIMESLTELDLPETITREIISMPEFRNSKESVKLQKMKERIRNKIKESLTEPELDLPEIITKEVYSTPELNSQDKQRIISFLMKKVKDSAESNDEGKNQKISESLPEAKIEEMNLRRNNDEEIEDIPEIDLKKERMKIQSEPQKINIKMSKELDKKDVKILAEKIKDDLLDRIGNIGIYPEDEVAEKIGDSFDFTYVLPNGIKLKVYVWNADYLGIDCNFAFNYNDEYSVIYENKKFTIDSEKPNVKVESVPDSAESNDEGNPESEPEEKEEEKDEKKEDSEFTDFKSLTPEEINFIDTIFMIGDGKSNMSYMKQINGMMVNYYIGNKHTIDSIEFQNNKYSFVFKNKVAELTNKQTGKTIRFMLRNYVEYKNIIQNNYKPPEVYNIPEAQGSRYDLDENDKFVISMILHIYNRLLDIKVQNPNNYKNYDTGFLNGVAYRYKLVKIGNGNYRWDIVGKWENYHFQNEFENGHEVIVITVKGNPKRVIKYYIELGQATKEDFHRRVARGIAVYKYYDDLGNSHKIKSGSIISKIKDAFEGKIEKSKVIRDLKSADVDLKREIKDLKEEILSLSKQLKELKVKPSIPLPSAPKPSKPSIPSFQPSHINIPTKPQLRHVELNSAESNEENDSDEGNSLESQLRRAMNNRRKDIEYSDDDSETDSDWGAGYSKMSAKDFIAKLKSGRLN